MKRSTLTRHALSVAAGGLLLASCGGGGGDALPADPFVAGSEVPVSATTSSTGATAFVRITAASPSETAEPIPLGDAALATSETDEPEPV